MKISAASRYLQPIKSTGEKDGIPGGDIGDRNEG